MDPVFFDSSCSEGLGTPTGEVSSNSTVNDADDAISCASSVPTLVSDEEGDDIPCNHNKWDNLRTRKGLATLRCRTCSVLWKTPSKKLRFSKCEKFVRCCPTENCTKLHIFRYKLPAKSRGKLLQRKREEGIYSDNLPSSETQNLKIEVNV